MVVHVDIIESFRSDNEYKYDQEIFIARAVRMRRVRDRSHKAANSWSAPRSTTRSPGKVVLLTTRLFSRKFRLVSSQFCLIFG